MLQSEHKHYELMQMLSIFFSFKSLFRINLFFLLFFIFSLSHCSKITSPSSREVPTNAMERARKNVEEGRGISIKGLVGNKSTNYEFSSSNPMWRATLETLDFLPLSVVDYSGGIIVSDWYSAEKNISIKISIRFLSNEIRSDNLKITVHQQNCSNNFNCTTQIIKSKIEEELRTTILKTAALLNEESKNKK